MNLRHQNLIRAIIALQVAVLEHADEDVNEHIAINAVEQCSNQISKLVKILKKEDS